MKTDRPNGNGVPPKINLRGSNGNGDAEQEPRKIVIKKPGEGRPADGMDRKSETSRVELPPSADQSAKKDTSRVDVPEPEVPAASGSAKKDSARIEVPASQALAPSKATEPERDKKQTARIDIADILVQDEQDKEGAHAVEPRGTEAAEVPAEDQAPAPSASPPGMPKTIRIKRPGSIPRSPAAETAPSTQPPPAATEPTAAERSEDTGSEVKKTATARIEIPADEASSEPSLTRRKTVRIKRSDGLKTGGGRALKIARPSEGETAPSVAGPLAKIQEEPEVGSLFAILALAALFVTAVLVYMLAAQLWPGLPFPGILV